MRNITLALAITIAAAPLVAGEPIPDKLVVLTFDDGCKSHFTFVRPILKKHKFGATFFITEGFDFRDNKERYMTWEEIAQLHRDGFEIGNHTRGHFAMDENGLKGFENAEARSAQVRKQLESINRLCSEHGIPKPTSFAYPGNHIDRRVLPILKDLGIQFARRGGAPEYPYKDGKGVAYEPGLDHPLLIPSAGDARPNWVLSNFKQAVDQARFGRIAVLQFHGVPDPAHPWVNTSAEPFKQYMQYLAENDFNVIALRDLARYVDPKVTPRDPDFVIIDRKRIIDSGGTLDNFRKPKDDADLRYWLENMVWHHRFAPSEVRAATGMEMEQVVESLERFNIRPDTRTPRAPNPPLQVLPYPGGRHPRIGFLDGCVRPQRETKISVFTPWDDRSYIVLDVPEAIRRNNEPQHGLLYLAHTHVDTMWTKRDIKLDKLEWKRHTDGSLTMERALPNNVVFGTKIMPTTQAVHMEMWLTNGSGETLSNLRVQNCIMLKGAPEFSHPTEETTVHRKPYIARRSRSASRWIITAWDPCSSTWFNPPCPCMHSDPQFPDCDPGQTRRLNGWLSFYEGDDIDAELTRIDTAGWR